MGFERAMVVFAHPDDAEFGSAGTVARWVEEGTEVAYVCVTDGSAGINEAGWTRPQIAEVRKREQRAACDVLGVRDLTFLDVMDGVVELNLELRKAITRQVRRFRPDVLVSPDPTRWWDDSRSYVNHTDHRTVGQAAMAVVSYDSSSRPVFSELLDEGLEPFEIKHLWISTFDADADTFVDISGTIEKKLEALHAHESQLRDERVDEWVRQRAKERGAPRGLEYAECYKTFNLREDD